MTLQKYAMAKWIVRMEAMNTKPCALTVLKQEVFHAIAMDIEIVLKILLHA